MPWGYECRAKLVKQNPPNFMKVKRKHVSLPGPTKYDVPDLLGGKGHSKIKRAPAYTFGFYLPTIQKPAVSRKAPILDVSYMTNKGKERIPGGIVTPTIEDPLSKIQVPGPGTYAPGYDSKTKKPPAYTMIPPAKRPYHPHDMWTPSPNMYWPPLQCKKDPAYTIGRGTIHLKPPQGPAPGAHDPNFKLILKTVPAFTFGHTHRKPRPTFIVPAPNTYCHHRYKYVEPTVPAPTFGIKHSPFLGKQSEYLRSSKLDLVGNED